MKWTKSAIGVGVMAFVGSWWLARAVDRTRERAEPAPAVAEKDDTKSTPAVNANHVDVGVAASVDARAAARESDGMDAQGIIDLRTGQGVEFRIFSRAAPSRFPDPPPLPAHPEVTP